MFKRSILLSVLVVGMTVIWVSESSSATCSRCRYSPWALCYEEILEKVKETLKVETAGIAEISIKKLSLGRWCNPAGQCEDPPDGDPFAFSASFDISEIGLFKEDSLSKARYAYDRKYWPECELWDMYFCAAGPEKWDTVCYKTDVNNNCEEWVEVCPKDSYYDYSKLPIEAYWSDGMYGKWTPEQLPCDDSIFPLGSPTGQGGFFVELLYVKSYKLVTTYDKKTDSYITVQEPLDAVCLQLEVVEGDRIFYERVDDVFCGEY
jgi:hypothetical protein